jgi:hypothetical protein
MRTGADTSKMLSGAEHYERILNAIKTQNPIEARGVIEAELKYFGEVERHLFESYKGLPITQ